jgi:hypothetical protein
MGGTEHDRGFASMWKGVGGDDAPDAKVPERCHQQKPDRATPDDTQ